MNVGTSYNDRDTLCFSYKIDNQEEIDIMF